VPSFEDSLDESETYPRGWVLFGEAHNWGNGTLFSERDLIVRLFFDATGRFTHSTLDERFVMM
jgi:hypothetical protein